ncbi:MAG: transcriptional regulator MntR [Verrucomicrobia bacterium]|jgi:Mn-dependent DtxR family transcriptional regulator|nr:transcriptional regulator MntR [Verrucomicrobiota bacterium]
MPRPPQNPAKPGRRVRETAPPVRPLRQRARPGAARPTRSTEDYLERIGELIDRQGFARVGDVAAILEVSQPSVTAMVQRLAEGGYLHYEKYRGLMLTAAGRAVADRIKDRHLTLKRFLSLLGLDEQTQEDDIEGWEHCLSAATIECLSDLADFLEARPELLQAFRGRERVVARRSSSSGR